MITLDACVLEAFLLDEFAAEEVEGLLKSGEQTIITAWNAAEVFDRLARLTNEAIESVRADMAELRILVAAVDEDLAAAAADLRSRHYHRVTRAVSLADCCAAAHALDRGARLATSDAALVQLMQDEGGEVISLPNSAGIRYPAT